MNFTLLSFVSINQTLNSPYFAFQSTRKANINSCFFLKHFRSIIYETINHNKEQLYIANSKFDSIYNSAIYISNENRYSTHSRLLLTDTTKHIITRTMFKNCEGFRGGSIHSEATHLSIAWCLFVSNKGNYGAAVYAGNLLTGNLTDSLFEGNFGRNLCSGYFLDSHVESILPVDVKRSNFTRQAATCVGAVECWGGFPRISFCFVDSCRSTFGLPAVRTSTVPPENVRRFAVVEAVAFINCSSRQYGAAFQSFTYRSAAVLRNCIVGEVRCDSDDRGTAIFIQNTKVKVIVENCSFVGKKVELFGGVKKMDKIVLRNVTFFDEKNEKEFVAEEN